MITTIHAHIEVKKDNHWFHFAAPTVDTNYILFAAINGLYLEDLRIRDQIHPQASTKGLPNDMSEVTAMCYQMDKKSHVLHDEGVLSAKDLRNLQKHLWDTFYYHPISKWSLEELFHTYINGATIAFHQGWDNVRIIFWYDN